MDILKMQQNSSLTPQPTITFILNGKTYNINAKDGDAIRQIPKNDRLQLIELLEAVKEQNRLAEKAIEQIALKAKLNAGETTPNLNTTNLNTNPLTAQDLKPERLGKGDVDDLMARLVMEDKKNQKPGITQRDIYKWFGGFVIVVAVLIYIFS